jgi:hypothetical protein
MKILFTLLMSFFLLLSAEAITNQAIRENSNNLLQDDKTVQKKGQNNNTVRSNRTENKVSSGQPEQSAGTPASGSKKGYDYYKANSELNSAGTKAQDHNSSRSNKTASSVAPDPLNSENDSTSTVNKRNHNSIQSNRTTNQEPGKK